MNYRVEKWKEPLPPDPKSMQRILTDEGYHVFQWSDPPGAIYGSHKHDEDQSHWIISGALELTVEDFGTFILEAGDRDYMPAGTYHSARVIGDKPAVYMIGARTISRTLAK